MNTINEHPETRGSKPPIPGIYTPAYPAGAGTSAPAAPMPMTYQKNSLPYTLGRGDVFLAISAFVLGFIFFEWILWTGEGGGTGAGASAFFAIAVAASLVYFKLRGVKQSKRSLCALCVLAAGILPFTLYDALPIYAFLLVFDLGAAVFWVMLSCRSDVSGKLSAYLTGDFVNQAFVIPFGNYMGAFSALKNAGKGGHGRKAFLIALLSLVCFVPVFIIVISLLLSADSGFSDLARRVAESINLDHAAKWVAEILLGIPVALYIFGNIYGNASKRRADKISRAGMDSASASLRKLPHAAVYAPLSGLVIIYAIFIGVMATYLFSALSGNLADGFSYAEYARRGFFELCGVAGLNFVVLICAYIFCYRDAGSRPAGLRIITLLLSVLTLLLCITAVSKMALYIDEYGLTRLRVYTMWFMALLIIVFVIVIVWHIKPFGVFRPVFIAALIMTLALFLANTDGIITEYNIDAYASGRVAELDPYQYMYMSDAVEAPLTEYMESGKCDADAANLIQSILDARMSADDTHNAFPAWNLQSARAHG